MYQKIMCPVTGYAGYNVESTYSDIELKEKLNLSPQTVCATFAMMKSAPKSIIFLSLLWISFSSLAQSVQIQLGPDEIGENQAWTIAVVLTNGQLRTVENFPDIDGLRKRGTSTQSQTSIVNGQVSSSQSVVMTYVPTRQGVLIVSPFTMKINDQAVNSPGKKIKIGPPVQTQSRNPFDSRDPFSDFFGKEETEFVDVKEDALLALTTSKDEVYVGEGLTATLSFLVADNNRAPMQFYELGKQLSDILKKLKPANCWEENFNIENIEGEQITINGKGYTQYKIYQAAFYPLNSEPIRFPSVGLQMIKFKVAKNPSFFGQNRQEDFKTFDSKPKTVSVKELPPHPLQNSVAVGNYQLEEKISTDHLKTGQSVGYEFNVYGEGNISSVERPAIVKDNNFDFYEPNVQQTITRENGRVAGTKSFRYFLVPKEPGQFPMKDYFQWIFFNPSRAKYDTLRSQIVLNVEGESQRNQAIQSTDFGSFYDRIETTDNSLRSTT
jgi:hypothetical protein